MGTRAGMCRSMNAQSRGSALARGVALAFVFALLPTTGTLASWPNAVAHAGMTQSGMPPGMPDGSGLAPAARPADPPSGAEAGPAEAQSQDLRGRTLYIILGAALLVMAGWNNWLRRQVRKGRQTEAALRESEANNEMILAATQDGLWRCDLETGVCKFSPSWYALLGYAPGDMPSRWGALEYLTHPEDQARLEALRDGSATSEAGGRFRVELRMRCKDGRWLPTIARGKVMEWNHQGKPRVLAGVQTDITARKQVEQALRESEQRAQALFEQSPISLWDQDLSDLRKYLTGLKAQGIKDFRTYFESHPQALRFAVSTIKVRRVNAMTCSMFEAENEAQLLGNLEKVFCSNSYENMLAEIVAYADGKTMYEGENCHKTLTGKQMQTRVRVRFAKGSEYDWHQALVSIQDITDTNEAEALREDVDRITRHDLKSPLAAVISLPKLLLEETNLTQAQRDALQMLQETGLRMLNMVNMSLDLYNMERGVYTYTPEPVDVVKVAVTVLEQNKVVAQERGVQLALVCEGESVAFGPSSPAAPSHCRAMGEELLLYSMFGNLIQNAMEASDNGQEVTVAIEKAMDWVVIRIHNHGAVPENIREHLFEKYVTAKPGGTGLGAYSARRMAETMQGDIRLSTSDAAGTTITVRLPIA